MLIESKLFSASSNVIGVKDDYIYISADTEEALRIYRKKLIDIGEWELFWFKNCDLAISKCSKCVQALISVYSMASNSILIFYGTGNKKFNFIKLDFVTGRTIEVDCQELFGDNDMYELQASEICNVCQNSTLRYQHSDESSIVLTHSENYLTTMYFKIDYSIPEIIDSFIEFSDDYPHVNEDYGFPLISSNIAITDDGNIAVINNDELILVRDDEDDGFTEIVHTLDDCSDISSDVLSKAYKIYFYTTKCDKFECIIWSSGDNNFTTYNIKLKHNNFTLTKKNDLVNFKPPKVRNPFGLNNLKFYVSDEYVFMSYKDTLTMQMNRVLSLSECAYLGFLNNQRLSINQIRKGLKLPKTIQLVRR